MGNMGLLDAAWKCSRYDYSWPQIVNEALGSSVKNFQFEACSGDRTDGIYNQVDALVSNLDVVMMTAGGNDLCLAAMIKTCVIMPFDGEAACQAIIDKATENINSILKPNIRQILTKLNGKIKDGGALVYSGYAPFFNTENEDCATKQQWAIKAWKWWQFWKWFGTTLTLTIERRKKFNDLVASINKAISEVVEEFDKDTTIKYRATFSDWSSWPSIINGEFCSPDSTGAYPDPDQPDLLFIKFRTTVADSEGHDVETLKRRDGENSKSNDTTDGLGLRSGPDLDDGHPSVSRGDAGEDDHTEELRRHLEAYRNKLRGRMTREHIYNSLLWRSANPRAEVLHRLDARAPEAPGCPGDGLPGIPLGLGLPDSFSSIFHPNEKGHEVMAAYALQNLVYLRAEALKVDDGTCAQVRDDFTCWSKEGRKAFVSWDRLNENYKDFCDTLSPPANTVNWIKEKTYNEMTPEEHTFRLQLTDGSSSFDKDKCKESFDRIINSCDGDPESKKTNPLNFKFGGRWVRGNYNYQINPKKERKMFTKKDGTCEGWWSLFFTKYRFYGRGWASHDWGQPTLLASARACGAAITGWRFEYCEESGRDDCGDYEWWAEFNAPVYFAPGCFRNNWIAHRAGGETYNGRGSSTLGCGGPNA